MKKICCALLYYIYIYSTLECINYYRAALNAGRFSHKKAVSPSVRPSVHLSVKRTIFHRTKEICAHVLTSLTTLEQKRQFSVYIRS